MKEKVTKDDILGFQRTAAMEMSGRMKVLQHLMAEKIAEVSKHRYQHLETYVAAYLVVTGADIRTLELVEQRSADGMSISWFLRPKEPTAPDFPSVTGACPRPKGSIS